MSAILNATKDVESDVLNVTQADKIFNELLQTDQDFAFNTLDNMTPKCTLFKTLFDKLDAQTKADYKIHLQRKTTVLAKSTLRDFYSDEDEFLLQEARKVSLYNTEQFKNFASEFKGCVLSTMNPITETVDSAIPEEHTSNSSENESISQDTWSTLEELEDQLPDELNFVQIKSFASKREGCVLSIMNPIIETVDSVIPEEHTSNSSENELISQDTWSTLEELEDQLPDELNFVKNQQSTEILDEFHRLEKGVSVEQIVKRQRR